MRIFVVSYILAFTLVLIPPTRAQIDGLANLPLCAVGYLFADLIVEVAKTNRYHSEHALTA